MMLLVAVSLGREGPANAGTNKEPDMECELQSDMVVHLAVGCLANRSLRGLCLHFSNSSSKLSPVRRQVDEVPEDR